MSFIDWVGGSYVAPITDVVVVVQDFASGTSTGNLDVTSAAISGVTPKAVIHLGTLNDVSSGSSETAHAEISIGLHANSGTGYAFGAKSRDNVASTNSYSEGQSRARWLLDPSNSFAETATATLISGGTRYNFADNDGTSRRGTCVFFTGADATAHTNRAGLGTGTSPIDIISPAFEPNLVIFTNYGAGFGSAISEFHASFGIATWDGTTVTQRAVLMSEANGAGANAPFASISTSSIAGQLGTASGGRDYYVTVGSFDSLGFSVTPSANSGNDDIDYLALKLDSRRMKLVDFTTPTSTGNSTITGVGFLPQFALVVLTNLEALDSYPSSTSANQSGLSICLIGNEQWSNVIRINSGAGPTDTASDCQSNAIQGASASSTSAIVASLVSFDVDGMTLNYSVVQGTGKKGFILFIE